MDFNVVLHKVGDFGLYQKLLCAFLVIPSAAFCALVYFTQFFIILVPEHHCKLPENESNWTNWKIPDDELLQRCYLYEWNATLEESRNYSERTLIACTHGWSYDFTHLYPTIATELNWVCDDESLPYTVQTIFYIGTCLGSVLFGFIADRYGRKPSIICSYILAFTGGLISSFVSNFYAFVILRFVVGSSIIPLSEDPYVLSLEYIGIEKRTLSVIFWVSSYIIFSAICPWIAYALQDWQKLSIATSVPLFFVILGGVWLPESASWLLTRKRHKDAVQLLKKVAKVNGREFPEEFEFPVETDNQENAEVEEDVTFFDLFRTPQLRKISLLQAFMCYNTHIMQNGTIDTTLVINWMESGYLNEDNYSHHQANKPNSCFQIKTDVSCDNRAQKILRYFNEIENNSRFSIYSCYHTNTQNASNLGTNIYDSFTYGALVEIPAMLIVLFGIDRFGRRWPIIIMAVLAAVAGFVTVFSSGNPDALLALALIQRICITADYNIVLQYSAELYPTVLRGRGLAFLRLMGTLGLFLSPSIVYLGLSYHSLPLIITGGVMFLVTIYAFFLPETLGQHLPHSIQDGESFGKNQNLLLCPCYTPSSKDCEEINGSSTPQAV